MKKTIGASEFKVLLSEIKVNHHELNLFHEYCVSLKINFKDTFYRIYKFLVAVNNWDSDKFTCEYFSDIHKKIISRKDRLKNENKSLSIIDLELFEIYCSSKEDAKFYYNEHCKRKTKKFVEMSQNDPEFNDNKSLNHHIKKYGEELGKSLYEEKRRTKYKESSKRCIEYWRKHTDNEDEAKRCLAEFQTKFSLKICQEKYGKTKGYEIWKERQERWQATLNNKPQEEIDIINIKKNAFSIDGLMLRGFTFEDAKISIYNNHKKFKYGWYSKECVDFIENNFKNIKDCYYGTCEYSIGKYLYDFTSLDKKLIFEYHGEKFHPNINILSQYELDSWRSVYNKTWEEVHKKDLLKKQTAESNGFSFFYIYSNDTEERKNDIIFKINQILTS